MLVISTQNWSILAKFAKKNPAKSAVFYWFFLGEVSPRNFPWNRLIFLRIYPRKSFDIWLFSAKIPGNRPIFPRICPWKSREILFFFPSKYQKPCWWGGHKGWWWCGFARFLVSFCGNFYFNLWYGGPFYKTKWFVVFRNFGVILMRFEVFLSYSVQCLYVYLCSFVVFIPPLHPPVQSFFAGCIY